MKNKAFNRTLKLIKRHMWLFIIAIICTIISVVSTLFIPIKVGEGIDMIIDFHNVDFNSLYLLLVVIGIIIACNAISSFLMQLLMNILINKMMKDLRCQVFDKLINVPISFIDSHSHGDLIMRIIGDIDQLGDGLLQAFTQLISGVITIVITLVFMFSVSYQVALIVVCLTPISLIVASLIARFSFKTMQKQAEIKGRLSAHTNEMMDMQRVVISYDYQQKSIEKFKNINNELAKVGVKAQFLSSLVNPSTRFINSIVYAFVGVFGALKAISGTFSVGNLTVFLSYASSYTKPFNDISSVAAEFQNALASAVRIFEIIDVKDEVEDANAIIKPNYIGHVKFDNVSFKYVENRPLIENFSLDIKPGSQVAIIGPTGSGKTTIINLLMRFYDVGSGAILIDDTDIKKIKRDNLHEGLGMVLQDTWLFKGSVYDNIRYAKPDATKEEIIMAAKESFAHNFIERLPNGYDTIISDDSGLSIGEKQLLCIARLMLKRPPILILDEATSNIDTRTEVLIQKAFKKLMTNKTSFIIAHRLSTIIHSDLIIAMKDGHIMETGTHEELMRKKGFYYQIYEAQFVKEL